MEMDAWLAREVGEDTDTARERYEYFMRPEPRENLSEIRVEFDEYLKRPMKVRDVRVGMIRNAKDEDKKVVKAYLEPYPHIRIDTAKPLQGWYKSLHEPAGVRARPCFSEAILTEPYGGWCAVGCSFCYINSGFRGYRGTGLITVPLDYGEQIRKQLSKLHVGAAGYFSSFTDPFTPLEEYYHNTELAAEEFVKLGLPIFFLSRLRYPDWAIELLKKNPHSYAQKSINTSNANDWKMLSPNALPLTDHFEDIRRLKAAGIYVSIQVNPILAGITTHEHIERLFQLLANAGADHVIVKFVEAGFSWANEMVERQRKRFGEKRAKAFSDLFTENIGGQRTICEAYRLPAHKRYRDAATRYGMTYATCYEYRMERDFAGGILDKTGISIGREFTTAEQCHGQKVPVYSRESLNDPFKPIDACPPSGCLYCAKENAGEPRCGDERLGSAKALRLVDLRKPIGVSDVG
jgi:DNA repair photolyase